MNDDEKRGYARGYAARDRRAKREQTERDYEERKRDFWQQALLAALPPSFEAQGWTDGKGKPINGRTSRTKLAAGFADDALREAIERGMV